MVKAKIITNHLFKKDKREEILHSSGYARAQSGASFGAAGANSFEARQAINQRRKFVRGYSNSRIMNDFYGVQRARERAQSTTRQSNTKRVSQTRDSWYN